MSAKANRAYVASVKEVTWGVTPATPTLQKVNFTAESLVREIETTTPESIRDDRMVADVIQQSAGNAGGYEFEMQFGCHGPDADEHLIAALWAADWLGANAVDLTGAVLTAIGSNLNTSTPGGITLIVGQKIQILGSALGNDGIYTVAVVNGADDYDLAETVTADETLPALTVMNGEYIKNGLTRHSFTMERGHDDVIQYFQYTGMVVNEFNLAIEAGEVITGGYTFVGKDATIAQVPVGSSYLDQVVTPFMSAAYNVRNVMLDGVPIEECLLMSLEININNNVEGKLAVGSPGYCNTSEGEFETTGAIVMHFNNEVMYEKYLANTKFSLSLDLYDDEGNTYNIYLPAVILMADPINVEGKNTDVMENAEYTAVLDPAADCMIQITRFPAP